MLWIGGWLRKKLMAWLARRTGRTGNARISEDFTIQPKPLNSNDCAGSEPPEETQQEQARTEAEPPKVEPETMGYNRAERRRLERRRRRHDKFVTPKGWVEPPPKPTPEPKLRTKAASFEVVMGDGDDKDATIYIHGRHHEDTQEVIYYEAEMYGEFNFRDTILQQLERYFVYLQRMKKNDPDAFGFYRQVGATLLPYVNTSSHDRYDRDVEKGGKPFHEVIPLADWFHLKRPSFGCFVYGADPETEKFELEKSRKNGWCMFVPKFMYFTKYKMPPATIQHISGGDIYTMTVWWDRPQDPKGRMKYGVPQEFGIWVSADGKDVRALRQLDTEMVRIRSKKTHKHFRIPKREWHIPHEFERWARARGTTAQKFLTGIFLQSVQRHEMMQYSMVRVAASKGEMTAVFAVNIHRMGYFFQDRDISLTDDGKRRKVFHMVRAHQRRDGVVIKFHFRGERQFTWAGYDISITIPGRDHINYADFNIGSIDSEWEDQKRKTIGMEQFGKRIADSIKRGV